MAELSLTTGNLFAGNEKPRSVAHNSSLSFITPQLPRERKDPLKNGAAWTVASVCNTLEQSFDSGHLCSSVAVKVHPSLQFSNECLISRTNERKLVESYRPFGQMRNRRDISWSSTVSAQTGHGNYSEAFQLFVDMMNSGSMLNENSLVGLLKESSSLDIRVGKQLHARSISTGYVAEDSVLATLITMYSSHGLLDEALSLFHMGLPSFNVPLWNSLISACVSNRYYEKSFEVFSKMMSIGMAGPTESTYCTVISACALIGKLEYGKLIHGNIIKCEYIDSTRMGNSLISFYAKCGYVEDAKRVFETISRKDVVSWNSIIAGHEQNGYQEEAINLFRRFLVSKSILGPNRISYLSVLSAISAIADLKSGKEVHGQVIKVGIEHMTTIANALITMYSKCKEVTISRLVFENMPNRDIISWNSLLQGLAQDGQLDKCLELFKEMHLSGVDLDSHSLTIVLGAISSDQSIIRILRRGREVHGYIVKKNIFELSVFNSILTMYAKSNKPEVAEKVFYGMSKRDTYSWNAMMDGYSINGCFHETLTTFLDMVEKGLKPDHLGFSILLTACSRLASLQLGKQFHAFVIKYYSLFNQKDFHLSVNNALLSMYSKCGSISDANSIFAQMTRRDVLSWTAMITAYAHHGMGCKALRLFNKMKIDGKEPNSVTFLGILTACAHAGLVEEGCHYFISMTKEYHLDPGVEHYACMVDIYGRSGQFEKAENLVETGISVLRLEQRACLSLWKVLLGACHVYKNLKLGIKVATKILSTEPADEAAHILLSNLYAFFGMWDKVGEIRRLMKIKGMKKEVGCSWIEVQSKTHTFVAGDVGHPRRKEIYEKIEELDTKFRQTGYIPKTEYVLHDVDEFQKEQILRCHSEKLALAFGLLQTGPSRGVIRVMKNLRVCGDCHDWMKFASQVTVRQIVLRDSRRFHYFKGGKCSCGDYW
ncbi:putative pentatricopeptide repeat-containing protein At3g23330 [Aristolochia californica]|uniref:putative pentatricopeptide repeat-containing protein At3g23330 n=1 Tax=Aristolochia californica TaxID=171875 RepID=UPI0035D90C67